MTIAACLRLTPPASRTASSRSAKRIACLFARRLEERPDYFERMHEGELRFAFALELFVTGLAATTTTGRP